eukprot:c19100_g1_i1 orf=181-1620(-)
MGLLLRSAMRFLILSLSSLVEINSAIEGNETYYIGFLAPSPNPSAASPIPASLAEAWQSAFHVALEVLNGEGRTYNINFTPSDSACDWMTVLEASRFLRQKGLIGIVGPACSGAALAAVSYMEGIPIVSFAATMESLSDRNLFPNFFRTVYSDSHQALAVLATMEKLNMTNATILCTKSYYSLGLAQSIQKMAIDRVLNMFVLESGDTSTIDTAQLKRILYSLQPNGVVILVVPPLIAEDIWKAAAKLGKTAYPWWYFCTDGATAFDPSRNDDTSKLVTAIQGEIGIAPFGGVYPGNSVCQKFFSHWRHKAYPGFSALGLHASQSYVPYVFDTVTVFFKIVDALRNAGVNVNTSTVLAALQGHGPGTPHFNGCTGTVQIDPTTGSRQISLSQPALYDLVSLVQNSWELKGRIKNATFFSVQPIRRPNLPNELVSSYRESRMRNRGLIAGYIVFPVVFLIIVVYLQLQHGRPHSYLRIAH